MNFNDRRKAKKAASATTKAQISAMAKAGTLRATNTSPGQRAFGKAERHAVTMEALNDWNGSRKDQYSRAATKVQGASDVGGYDGERYRAKAEATKQPKQKKAWLPKKQGK
jgi:hypothetical protein